MDEFSIVIMLKDKDTGFLEKELGSYKIFGNEGLILNVYAVKSEEDGEYFCHMKISTEKELADWEFDAIYDYYDHEIFGDRISSFSEVEDCYNSTWEIVFDFNEDIDFMETKINDLLQIHAKELESVFDEIKDKKDDYEE